MISDYVKQILEQYAWSKNPDDNLEFFKMLDFRKLKIVSENYVYDGSIFPQYLHMTLVGDDGIEEIIYVPFGDEKNKTVEDFF